MIRYNEQTRVFTLETKNTSYIFGFCNDFIPVNIYYGKKIRNVPEFEKKMYGVASSMSPVAPGTTTSVNQLPMEFSTYGCGDFRLPTVHLKFADGTSMSRYTYKGHKIFDGKKKLEALPATYVENDSEAQTLELTLYDNLKNVSVTLLYTVFEELDAIARSTKITNESNENVNVCRVMSATVDFTAMGPDYDMVHLDGAWARERSVVRRPLDNVNQEIYSRTGASSAYHNPFFALMEKKADELSGSVYGFNLIYSGNFTAGVEVDTYNTARAYIGINPFNFNWLLEPGQSFQSPEAVLVYSDEGLSGMSRIYHKLYRTRLCRGKFRDIERYALVNNWEGTYFNITEEKIVDIAKKGKETGLELMVLDDGWFGKRYNDKSSLGDWYVNREKLPNGIDGLANKVNEVGMKFGLWFEPEMVSPDSDLYRAHPDWAMHINGMTSSTGRNQLVLDLSRDDVCDYIINAVSDVLSSANIEYVKWDYNRAFSEIGSDLLSAERMGEICHRYTLGLYRIYETLTSRFPDILWEGCSSGGARYDGGILYYMPQIWASDDSDAGERMNIQYGTSVVYPFSSMGSHVSAVPNHQTGRITSMKTRGDMAMMGQFGFELDMSLMSDEEIAEAAEIVKKYKKYGEIFHKGDLYRLRSPFETNEAVLEFISEDKNTVIVVFCKRVGENVSPVGKIIKLAGLDPNASYRETEGDGNTKGVVFGSMVGTVYGGDELMNRGIMYIGAKDFETNVRVFVKE